ncbi:MAG TPA: nucleotidyltransferase domain-containing protein [Verrucomicrobiae bacterium]|jgi:hypothetical protein|nr:nucleotidyltransferase domain-containing protein [Verrucomicrobiae bacterium]
MAENTIPEKQITEFVARLQQAAGDNLESVVLYGSAVSGHYDPKYSNINLLCVLKDTALPRLLALAPAAKWWTKQKHPAPLLITREELERSADVFAIEMMDMRQHHRVLFGPDVVASLEVPMQLHRAQLEYELREKLILLRQGLLLAAGDQQRMWDLLLRSVPSFATLFRHALIAQGKPVPAPRHEAVQALAANLGWDASSFEKVRDVREHRASPRQFDVETVAAQYLSAIEKVTAAVDHMLDLPGAKS